MMKKAFLLIGLMMLLSACSAMDTKVRLAIEAAGDINPNLDGEACPLVLRIYQLKSDQAFADADFFSLYEKDEQLLAGDLVRKEDILLQPDEKREVFFEMPDDIRAIGFLGMFRESNRAQWRAVSEVKKNRTNKINLVVSGTSLTIE